MKKNHRQRSTLPANRELNRALSAHRPSSFGIRRPVDEESALPLLDQMFDLQNTGHIPDTVDVRSEPCVTLLPKRELGKQMTQGIVLGYKLGHAGAQFEHDEMLSSSTPNSITVDLGKVAVYKGYAIYVEVISERLMEERRRMYEILASIGFKGSHRGLEKPLHVTLGNAELKLSRTEEHHVVGALSEQIGNDKSIDLLPWEPYPRAEAPDITLEEYDGF